MTLSPADLWLFVGSFLALLLVPATLGRAAWLFPAWFAGVGLFTLFAPEALHPAGNVWVWLALTQGPWLLLVPDLLARGLAARALDAVPLRALLALSLLHLIGARHVFNALHGALAPEAGLEIAVGDTLTALGAAALWTLYRTGRTSRLWFRLLALFWNAHALAGTLAFSVRLARAHPAAPAAWQVPEPELHALFAGWPGALEALFWVPLALVVHAAVFYKLIVVRNENTVADVYPGRPS